MEANRVGSSSALTARQRGLLLALLTAVGLLAGGRVAQMAWSECGTVSEYAAPEVATPQLTSQPQLSRQPQLTKQEVALLAMACPSAIEQMPDELRPIFAQTVASQVAADRASGARLAPPYRRLAQREPSAGWLVDPSEWYVPEDKAKQSAPQEEPAEPEVEPQPTDKPADAEPVATPPAPAAPESKPQQQALPESASPESAPEKPAGVEQPAPGEADPPELDMPEAPLPPEPIAESAESIQPESVQPEEPAQETLPAPDEAEEGSAGVGDDQALTGEGNRDDKGASEPDRPRPRREAEVVPPPASTEPAAPTTPRATSPDRKPLFAPPSAVEAPAIAEPLHEPKPAPAGSTFDPPPLTPASPATPNYSNLSPHSTPAKPLTAEQQEQANLSHAELFSKNCYPSARECAKCHKKQYEEWSVSSHAYAFVSPMFHKFEQKITNLSQGTVGYFCTRCHSPVAVAMGESRDTPLWDMAEVAREGVTCIACHRVNERYAKTNGERRVVPGDIHAPVYGGIGGEGVAAAIADKSKYKVKTSPNEKGAGQAIHTEGRFFEHLAKAEFCTSCHQVAVHPGIKLEVVWEQYRASPACKKGVTCQHCHMGVTPGVASPYEITSIAEVGGKSVNNQRQHANHTFYGPGYSIAHPGIFPFHEKGNRWRIDEWLTFDWRAGWGTDKFEDAVADGQIQASFPKVWQESDDRYDAREIIEDNLRRSSRIQRKSADSKVMENGFARRRGRSSIQQLMPWARAEVPLRR